MSITNRFSKNKTARNAVGGMWKRAVKATNEEFFSIKMVINEVETMFVGFKNNRKTADNQPDFIIYEAKKE